MGTEVKTRLKQVLNNKKMSQKALAEKTDIGEYKISLLCSGKATNIHLLTARRICDALNCTLDEGFGDVLG
jgi:DNA-binding Xre family transcriptional regulator